MKCKKRAFKSFAIAERTAITMSLENAEIGHPQLKPYKCKNCGQFHLTSGRSDLTKADKQKLANERKFIKNESEYWKSKLNL